MKYVAFDLEVGKEVPEGGDWKELFPLGITCASTVTSDGHMLTWYHGNKGLWSVPSIGYMSPDEVGELIHYLKTKHDEGYVILTWNGLSFDFAVLADESNGQQRLCQNLAMDHVDMMFQILCQKGYPIGLNAVAEGLGLGGKSEGMSGALAPVMWKGSVIDRLKVLNYVDKDSLLTLEIAIKAAEQKFFEWTSRSGRLNKFPLWKGWLTVKRCLKMPKPDTSWMDNPMTRESFLWWMKEDV